MAYIKEPKGVDFIVAPTTLSAKDKAEISAYITEYKKSKSSGLLLSEPSSAYKQSKSKETTKSAVAAAKKD